MMLDAIVSSLHFSICSVSAFSFTSMGTCSSKDVDLLLYSVRFASFCDIIDRISLHDCKWLFAKFSTNLSLSKDGHDFALYILYSCKTHKTFACSFTLLRAQWIYTYVPTYEYIIRKRTWLGTKSIQGTNGNETACNNKDSQKRPVYHDCRSCAEIEKRLSAMASPCVPFVLYYPLIEYANPLIHLPNKIRHAYSRLLVESYCTIQHFGISLIPTLIVVSWGRYRPMDALQNSFEYLNVSSSLSSHKWNPREKVKAIQVQEFIAY